MRFQLSMQRAQGAGQGNTAGICRTLMRQRRGCKSHAYAELREGRREETTRTPDLGSEGAEEAEHGRSGWWHRVRTRLHHGPIVAFSLFVSSNMSNYTTSA
jgi:hypothetical protein